MESGGHGISRWHESGIQQGKSDMISLAAEGTSEKVGFRATRVQRQRTSSGSESIVKGFSSRYKMARMSRIVIVGQFDIHPEDAAAAAELMWVMMNETIRKCQAVCVNSFSGICFSGYSAFCGKRASHRRAKRLRVSFPFGSKPHCFETLRSAKYNNFSAASSFGKEPRVLITLRNVMGQDSTALVV
jgi:hypothetical protein